MASSDGTFKALPCLWCGLLGSVNGTPTTLRRSAAVFVTTDLGRALDHYKRLASPLRRTGTVPTSAMPAETGWRSTCRRSRALNQSTTTTACAYVWVDDAAAFARGVGSHRARRAAAIPRRRPTTARMRARTSMLTAILIRFGWPPSLREPSGHSGPANRALLFGDPVANPAPARVPRDHAQVGWACDLTRLRRPGHGRMDDHRWCRQRTRAAYCGSGSPQRVGVQVAARAATPSTSSGPACILGPWSRVVGCQLTGCRSWSPGSTTRFTFQPGTDGQGLLADAGAVRCPKATVLPR